MIISVLSSIAIWSAVFVIALRIITNSGIALPNNKVISALTCNKSLGSAHQTTHKEIISVFLLAFAFRIAVFLFSICAMYMFNDNINGFGDILEQYMKWDANNYFRIANVGYSGFDIDGDFTTIVFFPLYPWIMKIVNLIFRDLRVSGLLTSFALYSGACCFLYKLFSIDYSKSVAVRAIVYLSVFPHALFFGTLMNESMLLFTSAATLYYIRKHKWYLVGIWGAAAALSRMVGILLAIPAAVEWLEHYKIFEKLKNKDIKSVWKLFYSKGLWIFLMLLGTGIYLLCNYKVTGNCFKFLEYQEKYWNNGSCYFGSGITKMFTNAFTSDQSQFDIWIPETLSIIFVISTLLYGIRRNRSMYSAFLAVYIIINTGFDWPISVARYMTCAIPAFLFLSDFSERHKWTEPIITALMAIGLGIYLTGYLCWKQIL